MMKSVMISLALITAFIALALTWDQPAFAVERVAFSSNPAAKIIGDGKVQIAFAVNRNTDAAVYILNAQNKVVRHLAAGVLGENAPVPFKKKFPVPYSYMGLQG